MSSKQPSQQPLPPTSTAIQIRSTSPVPLSAVQEAEIRDLYHARVRAHCADEIRAFAACTSHRTVSILWACRGAHAAMNTCMVARATRAEEDAAREEWFARIPERAAKGEEREEWKREQARRRREWWDMDELGRRKPPGEKGGGG